MMMIGLQTVSIIVGEFHCSSRSSICFRHLWQWLSNPSTSWRIINPPTTTCSTHRLRSQSAKCGEFQHNQHIWIRCSLQLDILDSYDQSVITPFTFLGWKRKLAGTWAFSVAAQTVWNSLPTSVILERNIVSFQWRLKTYLFKAAYPP